MSNPIVPNSGQGGKSNPVPTQLSNLKSKNELLQDWIEDTKYAIEALQTWLANLKQWQAQATVSSEEFDRAYAVICDATLSEWAWVGLIELRMAITGEQAE